MRERNRQSVLVKFGSLWPIGLSSIELAHTVGYNSKVPKRDELLAI